MEDAMEIGMKFRSTLLAFSLVLAGLSSVAHAQAPALQGDAGRGKALAYTCHGCHGIPDYKNAYPTYSVPKLGGQHANYIIAALKGYGSQQRSHPTMYSHAATMSDQEMADIAAFLQAEEVKTGNPVKGTPPAVTATCVACHGNDGVGITPDYPTLAGQHADYIEHSLHAYKSGARKNPIMAGFVTALTDDDIKAIAAYFSSQKGLCATDEIRKNGKCK
jgi:cytochrome c553